MKQKIMLFMEALKAALKGEMLSWDGVCDESVMAELAELAAAQCVLPMLYEAVSKSPDWERMPASWKQMQKQRVIYTVSAQTMRTLSFAGLYSQMEGEGFRPLVVKGIVCRALYPNPDERISNDEDLLVPKEQMEALGHFLLKCGFSVEQEPDTWKDQFEITFNRRDGLRLELHRSMFSETSEAYGYWNSWFANAHAQAVRCDVDGGHVYTMGETDHFLYLICHMFKHFLHSGVGVRQLCDILMFAKAYQDKIDWYYVQTQCRKMNAEVLVASLFALGEKWLGMPGEQTGFPKNWAGLAKSPAALLLEVLDAGVYGRSSMARAHSSSMTLRAMAQQNQKPKKRAKSGTFYNVLRAACPPADQLSGRYPYLAKHKWMLPLAWMCRVIDFVKGNRQKGGTIAADSLKIGEERIELLKAYNVIK